MYIVYNLKSEIAVAEYFFILNAFGYDSWLECVAFRAPLPLPNKKNL